ncbi:glycosyltransferase family 2 protein [Flavobacterium sp. LS2R12]|uniref:glycosyltransferase family 2 protein n=1 Tax=unclassified Flavobacterium TaxID=196869 RepID=UPI003AAB0907
MENRKVQISFLITHYNRPDDLLQCLMAIKSLKVVDSEIVVSDDASQEEHLKIIQDYEIDKLITSRTNQGLAANINKGIRACQGEYIIYCQEDFILNSKIIDILPECFELLHSQRANMIRLKSDYEFKKLITLTQNIFLIPKFSFQNFLVNAYQYSDHPFITTREFYNNYGFYLENTSGDYGETEYAIRIFKSKSKIAIVPNKYISSVEGSKSVIDRNVKFKNPKFKINKSLIKIARAFRLHLECILYSKSKRGLVTYKNFRK